jgi:NTP pyrophosphatase (non-canonical NTP hydrolase)
MEATLGSKKAVVDVSTAEVVNAAKIAEIVEDINTNPDEWSAVAELLAITNTPQYNRLKLCEELTELTEVLLKVNNKTPDKRPEDSAVIDEVGDVIIRVLVLTLQMGIEEQIDARLEAKCKKLYKFYQEGKYKGGI